MEEELQCPVCHHLFDDPVILPCTHNVCYKCAESLILKNRNVSNEASTSYKINKLNYGSVDLDKLSLASDAVLSDSDSGYSGNSGCGGTNANGGEAPPLVASTVSRLVGSFESQNSMLPPIASTTNTVNLPSLPQSVRCLTCPICHRTLFLDERGAEALPKHTLMQSIVERFANSKASQPIDVQITNSNSQLSSLVPTSPNVPVLNHGAISKDIYRCQLCEKQPADQAVVKCIQCEVLYCELCRSRCHPARGPLAAHNLVSIESIPQSPKTDLEKIHVYRCNKFPPLPNKPSPKNGLRLPTCSQHPTEKNSLHCSTCRMSLCVQCQEEGRHKTHEVKAIGALFKQQKSELSSHMSALSNKARQAKDLVMLLRGTQDEIEKCSADLEEKTVAQCNHLIETVERKRDELILRISREKETKCKSIREQLQQCTLKLKQTTGLLEYCIEVMKDNDVAAFLQISQSLTERVSCTEKQWSSKALVPRVKSEFDMELKGAGLALAIDKLDFTYLKVPEKPTIQVEECGSKNNTITLAWTMPTASPPADGYKLEMDNGSSGQFREVYSGSETVCTVDGLHFNSVYRARVRAFNRAGHSLYSDLLHLQTSEVATFQFNPKQASTDFILSNGCNSVTSNCCEDRVIFGNVGFVKGIHYWEFTIDRFDSDANLAFGVALGNVDRRVTLGKDPSGWSICVGHAQCWILHDNRNATRTDTGVVVGSRVGVLLDLSRRSIAFYNNNKIQGAPLSINVHTPTPAQLPLFHPAVSINKNAEVTLHTGLRSPISSHQPLLYRNRSPTISSGSTQMPLMFKSQLSREGKTPRGPPPPPPLRRHSSSGNVSVKSEGETSTVSDPTPLKSFSSFFQKK